MERRVGGRGEGRGRFRTSLKRTATRKGVLGGGYNFILRHESSVYSSGVSAFAPMVDRRCIPRLERFLCQREFECCAVFYGPLRDVRFCEIRASSVLHQN